MEVERARCGMHEDEDEDDDWVLLSITTWLTTNIIMKEWTLVEECGHWQLYGNDAWFRRCVFVVV